MELAEKLIQLRKKRGLSRREVAEATGISENTYKKYEIPDSDKLSVRPPYERLCTLAKFYNVTTDYLLGCNTEEQDRLDEIAGEYNLSLLEKKILENYLALPTNTRGDLMAFLEKSVKEVKKSSDS